MNLDKFRSEHRHITSYYPIQVTGFINYFCVICGNCEISVPLVGMYDWQYDKMYEWMADHAHDQDYSYVELASR